MEKACVRYIIGSSEWFRVEEKLGSSPKLLGYACEMLFKKKFNEVFSINKRHSLLERGFINKIETVKFLSSSSHRNKLLDNPLIVNDQFSYTEERVIESVEPYYRNKQKNKK